MNAKEYLLEFQDYQFPHPSHLSLEVPLDQEIDLQGGHEDQASLEVLEAQVDPDRDISSPISFQNDLEYLLCIYIIQQFGPANHIIRWKYTLGEDTTHPDNLCVNVKVPRS